MADVLTIDTFKPLLKSRFLVELEGPELGLTLVEVAAMRSGTRDGGAFSLLWEGPASQALGQGTYRVSSKPTGAIDLFIVPVGQFDDVVQYEAVFT